jgi:rfaE bifunctional protein nucleotidyltransferase chain/domain
VPAAQVGSGQPAFERKILAPVDVAHWAARLARPLVFTNGVFDILHRGHVTYLARARALGAALLVALNGDASARRLGKGLGRPVNALEDRMALVAALESVDAVTWFDEDTPAALIAACRPEVLVKGGDWPVARIVGASEVLARGGAVHSIPFEHQRSTTALLRRVGAAARVATRRKVRQVSAAASKRRGARSRARRKGR